MKPRTIILLVVAAFLYLGGFALSAESEAGNPWALVCFAAGALVSVVALSLWRHK